MKKLAAVAVIVLGCRVAKCQDVAGGISPMAQDSKEIVLGVRDTGGMGMLSLKKPVGNWGRGMWDTAGNEGRGMAGDTIREVSMATGWGSKADTVPRFDWNQGLPAWKQPFPY